jgi:hypothetical protein
MITVAPTDVCALEHISWSIALGVARTLKERQRLPRRLASGVSRCAGANVLEAASGESCSRFNREQLIEYPIVRFPICLVAPAGSGPESAPVTNRDIAAAVMDEPAILQGTRRLGDADSADA